MGEYEPGMEEIRSLAAAIIYKAVDDWHTLVITEPSSSTAYSYSEIKRFLTDGLGEDLCYLLGYDGGRIVMELEKFKYNYQYGSLKAKKYSKTWIK